MEILTLTNDIFCSQELNLHGNKIKSLPSSFCLLKKLRIVNLDMNPLESPPLFLIHEGIEALVNYCCARGKIVADLTSKLSDFGMYRIPCCMGGEVLNKLSNNVLQLFLRLRD